MNSLSFPWRVLRVLFAVLLLASLHRPARAGEWKVERYVWNGASHNTSLYYSKSRDVVSYTQTKTRNLVCRENTSIPLPPGAGNNALGHYISLVNVRWDNINPMSDSDVVTSSTIQSATSRAQSSVCAVLKWHRNQILGQDDPYDNPPKFLYLSENVSISGSRNTYHIGRAYSLTPWPGDFLKVFGHAGSGDLQVALSSDNWQYGAGDGSYGYSNSASATKIHRYNVTGDTVIAGSVSYAGQAKLSPGYEQPQENGQGTGSVGFSYTAEPLSYGISANSNRIFRTTDSAPDHLEMDAWAKLNWKSEDIDKPDVPFWDGASGYSAFASLGSPNILSPQFFKWSASPSPYVQQWLPDDPTGSIHSLYTTEGSRSDKEFHFDLGNQTAALPKSSTVKATIGKDDGGAMSDPTFGPASATIHWHSPFEGADGGTGGGGTGADDGDTITLLPGGQVTMATVRDDAGVPHTPAPKSIQDVQVGDKVIVPGHPLRRVVVSKETLANGSICLHLGLDPDDNPLDPAFDLLQQGDRLSDAHLQAQHTGAKGVKAGFNAYVALAQLPFYEFGGAAAGGVIGEAGEIAEGLKAAKELERGAAEAGEVAGEERVAAGELRQAATEAAQEGKTAEAAEDIQKAEAAEKDASQLEAERESLGSLAEHTKETSLDTKEAVQEVVLEDKYVRRADNTIELNLRGTVEEVRARFGFGGLNEGEPILVDEQLPGVQLARRLRELGVNARSVVYGVAKGVKDPELIALLQKINGRIICKDLGQDRAAGWEGVNITLKGGNSLGKNYDEMLRQLAPFLGFPHP